MDRICSSNYDTWCYTASKTAAREKLRRGKSKSHRAKEKLMIRKGELN